MSPSSLVSVGYEGRTVTELAGALRDRSVTVLVDLRLTPLSRKPGYSKRKLAEAVEAAGIRYLHLPAWGNPPENRARFRAGDPDGYAAYRQVMATDEGLRALRLIASLLTDETVALLCFERDHNACHRRLVAAELQRSEPGLNLIAL